MKSLFEGNEALLKQLKEDAGLVSTTVKAPKLKGVKVVGQIKL